MIKDVGDDEVRNSDSERYALCVPVRREEGDEDEVLVLFIPIIILFE